MERPPQVPLLHLELHLNLPFLRQVLPHAPQHLPHGQLLLPPRLPIEAGRPQQRRVASRRGREDGALVAELILRQPHRPNGQLHPSSLGVQDHLGQFRGVGLLRKLLHHLHRRRAHHALREVSTSRHERLHFARRVVDASAGHCLRGAAQLRLLGEEQQRLLEAPELHQRHHRLHAAATRAGPGQQRQYNKRRFRGLLARNPSRKTVVCVFHNEFTVFGQ
eukprot:scaffold1355_cov268-Pinguiococcus_pyrenoidosus.AAC.94